MPDTQKPIQKEYRKAKGVGAGEMGNVCKKKRKNFLKSSTRQTKQTIW